jgi:hypothetical protein
LDQQARELADNGSPIVLQAPDTEIAQQYVTTAKEIVNLIAPKPRSAKRISLPVVPMAGGHSHSH